MSNKQTATAPKTQTNPFSDDFETTVREKGHAMAPILPKENQTGLIGAPTPKKNDIKLPVPEMKLGDRVIFRMQDPNGEGLIKLAGLVSKKFPNEPQFLNLHLLMETHVAVKPRVMYSLEPQPNTWTPNE